MACNTGPQTRLQKQQTPFWDGVCHVLFSDAFVSGGNNTHILARFWTLDFKLDRTISLGK